MVTVRLGGGNEGPPTSDVNSVSQEMEWDNLVGETIIGATPDQLARQANDQYNILTNQIDVLGKTVASSNKNIEAQYKKLLGKLEKITPSQLQGVLTPTRALVITVAAIGALGAVLYYQIANLFETHQMQVAYDNGNLNSAQEKPMQIDDNSLSKETSLQARIEYVPEDQEEDYTKQLAKSNQN